MRDILPCQGNMPLFFRLFSGLTFTSEDIRIYTVCHDFIKRELLTAAWLNYNEYVTGEAG